jgi:hypothetical protein
MLCVVFVSLSSISYPSLIQGKYRNWAKGAEFISKLPGDIKKRKAAVAAEEMTRTLDHDLIERKPSERVIPYSNKLFRQVAVEWVAATDQVWNPFLQLNILFSSSSSQPIQALEHPKFKELIGVASRATTGVTIPGRRGAQAELMRLFKNHLTCHRRGTQTLKQDSYGCPLTVHEGEGKGKEVEERYILSLGQETQLALSWAR